MKSRLIVFTICCLMIMSVLLMACAPAAAPEAKTDTGQAGQSTAADTTGKPVIANIMFTPSDADDALHDAPEVIYEWWYMDAVFDNGYSVGMSWQISDPKFVGDDGPTRLAQFAIYDPSGKKTSADAVFAPEEVKASKTSCDVTMGSNYLKGSIPVYNVEFHNGDLGCKLTFENMAEGFRSPPDGVAYFTKNPDRYIGWVIAQPRAKVTGTLFFNGKEIPVSGVGYHDHNWGNIALSDMYNYWYWGRIFLPEYSFIYSVGEMRDYLGKKPSSVILVYQGEKLVDVTTDITAEGSDFILDKLTGAEYPQELVLNVNGKQCSGTISHKLNHLVEAALPWAADEGQGHAYFRFLSDCDIKLDIAGEKLDIQTPLLHEYMIP
ncbi:MAG: hypothetical protein JXA01_04270 [Dehalococcoidia bacterium]|nr:hypothetical protein [Dehalococcoidia bacterium]